MKYGNIMLGVLVGLSAGAALGLLFAPEKGLNMRKKISKKSREDIDAIKSSITNIQERIANKIESKV